MNDMFEVENYVNSPYKTKVLREARSALPVTYWTDIRPDGRTKSYLEASKYFQLA